MSDFEGLSRGDLVEKCHYHGLKLTGNKNVLKERLRRHLTGEGSEYARTGVPKREREEPVAFANTPTCRWFDVVANQDTTVADDEKKQDDAYKLLQRLPVDIWKKIFSFAPNGYLDWMRLRLSCKYFHRSATALMLQMSKEWVGCEDMLMFGFLSVFGISYSKGYMCDKCDIVYDDFMTSKEVCQEIVKRFKNFASAREKWRHEVQKVKDANAKRAKTLSVKQERAKQFNSRLDELGLRNVDFNGGHYATPEWFKEIAMRIPQCNRPNDAVAWYFLYKALSEYLRTNVEKGIVSVFFEKLTPQFAAEAKENNWL